MFESASQLKLQLKFKKKKLLAGNDRAVISERQ